MQRPTFFARRAILILVVVFFFVPFALRGARMAVQGMKNDVKDWLPKEFDETKDLDEFRQYFLSEQFVLVSWDGCHGGPDDERFRMFLEKLTPKPKTTQGVDLCVKFAVEIIAFCQINGMPGDSFADFVKSLSDYQNEALMRISRGAIHGAAVLDIAS